MTNSTLRTSAASTTETLEEAVDEIVMHIYQAPGAAAFLDCLLQLTYDADKKALKTLYSSPEELAAMLDHLEEICSQPGQGEVIGSNLKRLRELALIIDQVVYVRWALSRLCGLAAPALADEDLLQ